MKLNFKGNALIYLGLILVSALLLWNVYELNQYQKTCEPYYSYIKDTCIPYLHFIDNQAQQLIENRSFITGWNYTDLVG